MLKAQSQALGKINACCSALKIFTYNKITATIATTTPIIKPLLLPLVLLCLTNKL